MKTRCDKPNLSPQPPQHWLGLMYALTLFVAAFLLFQIQPMMGKYTLPHFGGSSEVWTTCLLFFQVVLLAGYGYAHLSARYLRPAAQAGLNVVLLIAALALLPVAPRLDYDPISQNPTLQILLLLGQTIGIPYLVLSATSPLLQQWFSRIQPGRSPYWLYAFSNAGSLLGLLSYPFLIEPLLSRRQQGQVWSVGLMFFALLCTYLAVGLWRHARSAAGSTGAGSTGVPPVPLQHSRDGGDAASPTWGTRLLWLGLPMVASIELLAVTNKITQDVTAAPFLWTVPLCLYLLSFIICFHSERWYVRPVVLPAFGLFLPLTLLTESFAPLIPPVLQLLVFATMLLLCAIVCHGEVFRLRPHPRHLTQYYLMIAAGGAMGGFLVAVVAPRVFNSYMELDLGLAACCLLVLLADRSPMSRYRARRALYASAIVAMMVLMVLGKENRLGLEGQTHRARNFFGVVAVKRVEHTDPAQDLIEMIHGETIHGTQFVDPHRRREPTGYYAPSSGAGLALRLFPGEHRRIGLVGLGTGTLAAYGRAGDVMRFYEINPAVTDMARTYFSFLADSAAKIEIVPGDARLSMQREVPQDYDLLFLDAFSGDAVPVHLLTAEAMEVYLRHLRRGGVIAFHLSSQHLDLAPVVWKLARHAGLSFILIRTEADKDKAQLASTWVLLSREGDFLNQPAIRAAAAPSEDFSRYDLWTDDHTNLLEILTWGRIPR
ncbi:MAG: fused MFS/spermidine synthase [Phycisphaerae bacterium]|jgi:hypothetical protein